MRTANHIPHAVMNARGSVPRDKLPPQPRIVLAFIDRPDVFSAVLGLADEVPTGFEEGSGGLHFGCG